MLGSFRRITYDREMLQFCTKKFVISTDFSLIVLSIYQFVFIYSLSKEASCSNKSFTNYKITTLFKWRDRDQLSTSIFSNDVRGIKA